MIRTTPRRLRSALLAVTLTAATAGTAVAVAGPAAANGSTCTPSATITVNGHSSTQTVRFGDYVTVQAEVAANCTGGTYNPTTPLYGTLQIQRTTNGTTWTTIATGSTAGFASVGGKHVVPRVSGFRAVYTGGTDPTYNDTYAGSTSSMVIAHIYRSSKEVSSVCSRRGCTDTWRFGPATSIKGLRVQIQRKVSGHWKTVTRVRASSTGTIRHTFPIGANRMVLPPARGFDGSYILLTVSRYRPTVAREALR